MEVPTLSQPKAVVFLYGDSRASWPSDRVHACDGFFVISRHSTKALKASSGMECCRLVLGTLVDELRDVRILKM